MNEQRRPTAATIEAELAQIAAAMRAQESLPPPAEDLETLLTRRRRELGIDVAEPPLQFSK